MPSLTERKKWRKKRKNLKEGGVVLVAEPVQPRGIWPSGRIVSTPAWIRWDGPSSHGAYSIRGFQETNHKTVFLRLRQDLL